MKLTKIQSTLILLGFATLASAPTASLASAAESGTSYVHTAQAPSNQSAPGGNQGGPGMGQGGGQQHKGPPPQAIEACQGKSAGSACSFTGRNGEALSGTCFAPPAGGPGAAGNQTGASNSSGAPGAQGNRPLACRPDRGGQSGMPQGKQRGPNAAQGGQG